MREVLHPLLRQAAIIPLALVLGSAVVRADKLVDPSKVAPEFREAAEKRRAEQIRMISCHKSAQEEHIQPRELPKYMTDCFDKPGDAPK